MALLMGSELDKREQNPTRPALRSCAFNYTYRGLGAARQIAPKFRKTSAAPTNSSDFYDNEQHQCPILQLNSLANRQKGTHIHLLKHLGNWGITQANKRQKKNKRWFYSHSSLIFNFNWENSDDIPTKLGYTEIHTYVVLHIKGPKKAILVTNKVQI